MGYVFSNYFLILWLIWNLANLARVLHQWFGRQQLLPEVLSRIGDSRPVTACDAPTNGITLERGTHSWTLRSSSELADFQEKLNKHLQSWSGLTRWWAEWPSAGQLEIHCRGQRTSGIWRVRVYQDETGLQCQYWTGDTSLLKKLQSGPGRLMVALLGLLGGLGFCIQSAGSWQDYRANPFG